MRQQEATKKKEVEPKVVPAQNLDGAMRAEFVKQVERSRKSGPGHVPEPIIRRSR